MSSISNIFGKKAVKSFAEQLAEVKNIFKTSYDQAIALNAAIAEDIKVKQNEIASIQTQIDFNSQVAEDNSKYIAKLKRIDFLMYLNIKIKEDFRTLKKDSEYKFDFAERNRYLMVGPNGCGKIHTHKISCAVINAIILMTTQMGSSRISQDI